jgi:predicted DsbA family dithiol-disulfide isomerase
VRTQAAPQQGFAGVTIGSVIHHLRICLHMPTPLIKIDFVSDVACPWCVIGLRSLLSAVDQLQGQVRVTLHFQPFELNPAMPPEGEETTAHIMKKYGISAAQAQANREAIRVRGAELGFKFGAPDEPGGGRHHIYNTFDAHRLLHWAGLQGAAEQLAVKEALFAAYFTDGENPGSAEVLLRVARLAGLDAEAAAAIINSDRFAAEVRAQEQFFIDRGIRAVPAVIINDRHLISGGQPTAVFEQALRQIAAQPDVT